MGILDNLILLSNDTLQIGVSDSVGAGIHSLKYKKDSEWLDIMRPTPDEAVTNREAGLFASFNMIPYSNRIENGRLVYNGKKYSLEINNSDGHTIHGDVRTRPWKLITHQQDMVAMEFDSRCFDDISWPFDFTSKIEYRLDGNILTTSMVLKNCSEQIMPGGMGIHPFFMRKLTEGDEVFVKIPTCGIYPGESTIPTGHWIEIPDDINFEQEKRLQIMDLDKCYRVLNQPSYIRWDKSRVRLAMESDEIFKHMIVFCPKDNSEYFALEPVTNCNNAFNMKEAGIDDTGTIDLAPGQEMSGKIEIKLESY
jgi:aldose 1-epimerase